MIGGVGRGFGQFSWAFLTFMLGVRLFGGQSPSKNFFLKKIQNNDSRITCSIFPMTSIARLFLFSAVFAVQ